MGLESENLKAINSIKGTLDYYQTMYDLTYFDYVNVTKSPDARFKNWVVTKRFDNFNACGKS